MKWCVHHTDTSDITMQTVRAIMNRVANEGKRIWENTNSREIEVEYIRLDSPTQEPVVNFGFVLQEVKTIKTMESYAPRVRVVEHTSSMFRSCRMMLIWPWVRVEEDHAGDLEHANMIVFIMKKSDLDDETDHSYNIYRHQEMGKGPFHVISDFVHFRKEIQIHESLQANWPLCNQADNIDSTDESETCFLQDGLESPRHTLRRVKHEVDI